MPLKTNVLTICATVQPMPSAAFCAVVEYDGRLKKLTLTPKAAAIHEMIREKIIEMEKRLCRGLSEEEMASFFSIVDKIKHNLEETVE